MIADEDRAVAEYFFTNTDKPVFFVKNFPPEVWALMQAQYSRSKTGLREGFLELLKSDANAYAELKAALATSGNKVAINTATTKASQFIQKWVHGFGHMSVAEGAFVAGSIEGLSVLATKVVEDNRLGSFLEKSTRYVSFEPMSGKFPFYMPERLAQSRFGAEAEAFVRDLFTAYYDFHGPVLNHFRATTPRGEMDQAQWEKKCMQKRFDVVRYLLPAGVRTSMGFTMNARNLSYAITKLKSSPLEEMRELGEMIQAEGRKRLPSLLDLANADTYIVETRESLESVAKQKASGVSTDRQKVKLVRWTEDADAVIIASLLYKHSHRSYSELLEKAKSMDAGEREHVFNAALGRMEHKDVPVRELEHASFTFDVLMDYGAYRDVQRHRLCTQSPQMLSTFNGYEMPAEIEAAGLKEQYDAIMLKADALYMKIHAELPYEAQYIVPFAYRQRYLLTANLRQVYYMSKLRSQPAGHWSYREWARMVHDEVKARFPLAMKYARCYS